MGNINIPGINLKYCKISCNSKYWDGRAGAFLWKGRSAVKGLEHLYLSKGLLCIKWHYYNQMEMNNFKGRTATEVKDYVQGRVKLLLWKGMTNFMEGLNHFYGRARPLSWKGRTIFMEGQDGSKFRSCNRKIAYSSYVNDLPRISHHGKMSKLR